jgi:hypothetical protein
MITMGLFGKSQPQIAVLGRSGRPSVKGAVYGTVEPVDVDEEDEILRGEG